MYHASVEVQFVAVVYTYWFVHCGLVVYCAIDTHHNTLICCTCTSIIAKCLACSRTDNIALHFLCVSYLFVLLATSVVIIMTFTVLYCSGFIPLSMIIIALAAWAICNILAVVHLSVYTVRIIYRNSDRESIYVSMYKIMYFSLT